MGSAILWHGTPSDRPSSELGARQSLFDALWLTTAPEVAANYAGMGGWVHGFMLAPDARILRADGLWDRPDTLSYPDEATWEGVRGFLVERGCSLEYFDSVGLDGKPILPLGPGGVPSWEGLLFDLSECHGDGEELLSAMGMAGFLYTEQAILALNDRPPDRIDPDHKRLAAALDRRRDERVPTVAVLDPANLVPACRLPARHVAQAYNAGHGLMRTAPDDLARWMGTPSAPAPSRAPAPA